MSETAEKAAETTEKRVITKSDLRKAWWRWILAVEVPVCFDRMQALSFGYAMDPIIDKLYKDNPEGKKEAYIRHNSMFNTNCDWGSIIHGIVISMEEQKALGNDEIDDEAIRSIKLGLMGPLAGIGDTFDQGIVVTLTLAIFTPLALDGNLWAAFMPFIIFEAYAFTVSWLLIKRGYELGRKSVFTVLKSGKLQSVIRIASIVGTFMIGALAASYVKVTTPLTFSSGSETKNVQDLLDGILPKLLPFIVTMAMYRYIQKNGAKYIRLIIFTFIICIVLTFIGIL